MNLKKSLSCPGCHNKWLGALFLALCGFVETARSQVVSIDFADVQLQPNLANQPVDLFVTVSGADLTGVTGIATETESLSGTGPTINNVDLFTAGSLFASNNNGAGGAGSITSRVFERGTGTSTPSTTIPVGTWKYGTAYFDTTGITPNSYGYSPNTQNGPTLFHTLGGDFTPQTLAGGTLTVVPEPSLYAVIAGLGCLAFGAIARRVHK